MLLIPSLRSHPTVVNIHPTAVSCTMRHAEGVPQVRYWHRPVGVTDRLLQRVTDPRNGVAYCLRAIEKEHLFAFTAAMRLR